MKIGIDIDDTITNTSKLLIEYIHKYGDELCESKELVSNMSDIIRGKFTNDKIKSIVYEHGAELIKNVRVKPNAKKVINDLLKQGHQIIIITTRGNRQFPNAEEMTKNYLSTRGINYTKLVMGTYEKVDECKENNIDILIDDTINICEQVKENGIDALLFGSLINKNVNTQIDRVSNWLEVEEYINKYKECT